MNLHTLSFSQRFLSLGDHFFSKVTPTPLNKPYWVHINKTLADELGISTDSFDNPEALRIFSGSSPMGEQQAISMVYAGHQFGGFSPQLGDGRAVLIAQIETQHGTIDLHLKGAGKTPYSRFGDGRAVLRSSIREYLGGEALHHLGIATTRALCLVGSEEAVIREEIETGAMIARTAKTHIRFGHFEYFHYNEQYAQVKQLADFVIEQFLPHAIDRNNRYQQLLQLTVTNTAKMIAQWQSVGFAHGVMNTDNMSIIGETLDYGPYGFLDDYDPGFICNHSDHNGRYAFDRQPSVALWNLNALAHALSSLIESDQIKKILMTFEPTLVNHYSALMRTKLGLTTSSDQDQALCANLLELMAKDNVDYSYFFRLLSTFNPNQKNEPLERLFNNHGRFQAWCHHYAQRLVEEKSDHDQRRHMMNQVNPKYIARNYLLQQAIEKAQTHKDFSEVEILFNLLNSPFEEHPSYESYAKPAPQWGKELSISCSS